MRRHVSERCGGNKKSSARTHIVYHAIHLRFVRIHPFGDRNGRVARLVTNYILHRAGYPMFDIEFKLRGSYFRTIERANLKGDELAFLQWFFTRYVKANSEYLRLPPGS
ncbi:MAG: Fic family protein [Promethearchaeota archaeon]